MKSVRIIKVLLIVLILILGGIGFNQAYAVASDSVMMKAESNRPFSDNNADGTVGNDSYRFLKYTIFKLHESLDTNYLNSYYCMRGRVGFGGHPSGDVTTGEVSYISLGDMHANAKNIIKKYNNIYYGIDSNTNPYPLDDGIDRIETIQEKEVNIYNAILWILDESYLPNDVKTINEDNEEVTVYNEEDYKKDLLTKAGIPEEQQTEITKDDIEVIQQLAIWFFANYNQIEDIPISRESEDGIPDYGVAYLLSLEGETNNNIFISTRGHNLNQLYTYLVDNAIENNGIYGSEDGRTLTTKALKFDQNQGLGIQSHNFEETGRPGTYHPLEYYYLIGPFKIGDVPRNVINSSDIVLGELNLDGTKGRVIPRVYTKSDSTNTTITRYEIYEFVDENLEPKQELHEDTQYYIKVYKMYTKGFKLGDTEAICDYDVNKVYLKISSKYSENTAEFFVSNEDNGDPTRENKDQPIVRINKKNIIEEDIIESSKVFDLALRKYITSVSRDGENFQYSSGREPNIDWGKLNTFDSETNEKITTAEYKHKKNPVEVCSGDIVTYRFTVYNEGDITGVVDSITDYLPDGLEFDETSNPNFILYKDYNTELYTEEELTGKEYSYKIEGNKITIMPIITTATMPKLMTIEPFDGTNLNSKSIDVKFKVTAPVTANDQVLTNVATMEYGCSVTPGGANFPDRDSKSEDFAVPNAENLPGYRGSTLNKEELEDEEYYYKGQEDDDDFEKIIIRGKEFDLALRKYITSINGQVLENDRTPKINTETLINGTFNRNGVTERTATYEHTKEPLLVKQGDIITYTLRVYNEGDLDGYASEIADYIPEGLALINNYNTNFNNGWKLPENLDADKIMNLVGEQGFYKTEEDVENLKLEDFSDTTSLKDVQLIIGKVKITTNELDIAPNDLENHKLIKSFDINKTETQEGENWQKATEGNGGLYYQDVQVSFLVIAPNTCLDVLKNIAEISDDKNENGESIDDRDSIPDNVETKNEDDDDFEPVILRYFDLALRKFITGVETNGKLSEVTSRIPEITLSEDGKITYNHSKEPVKVANNDIIIYTIRVYNEGTLAGYAEEVTDDIPEGLEYLKDNQLNKKYEWEMVDKDGNITQDVTKAVKIMTDYLSQEKSAPGGRVITDQETGETVEIAPRDNEIKPFDPTNPISIEEPLNPHYKDVQVAFKVIEPTTSDRILINSAQISEDSDDDEDSIPDEWNEGEDDQDKEYVYVKYFDLSILKWVTKTEVTVDGKTTTTETGFKPNQGKTETTGIRNNKEQEPVAKVEVDKKKLNKTIVKFIYTIRVTNEGEIAGYATEITDFIPEGLEFNQKDNNAFGWVKEGDNKVKTRALETVLLNPGESKELEIVFTWKNDKNNLGIKTNVVEITEDYNEYDSKDIDSTPNNKKEPYEKEQEDDDDFALVILSIKTGKNTSYTLFITMITAIFAGGIYLIKKYVLTY